MGFISLNQLEDNEPFVLNEENIVRVTVSNSNTLIEYIREEDGLEDTVFVTQTQDAILAASSCLTQISEIISHQTFNYLINVDRVIRLYENIDNSLLANIEYEFGGAIRRTIFSNSNYTDVETAIKSRKSGGTPGAITAVRNQVVLVDKTNGDNNTATKYDLSKPYQTIEAAHTAATAGDTIVVLPAATTYDTYNSGTATYPVFGKNNVNWFIYPGVTIDGIWEDGGNVHSYTIWGQGKFKKTRANGDSVFKYDGDGNRIVIYFDSVENTSSNGNAFEFTNDTSTTHSQFFIHGNRSFSNVQYSTLYAGMVNAEVQIGIQESNTSITSFATSSFDGTINNIGVIRNLTGDAGLTAAIWMSASVSDNAVYNQFGNVEYTGSSTNKTYGVVEIDRGEFNHMSGMIKSNQRVPIGSIGSSTATINIKSDIQAQADIRISNVNCTLNLMDGNNYDTQGDHFLSVVATNQINISGRITTDSRGISSEIGDASNVNIGTLEIVSTGTESIGGTVSPTNAMRIVHDLTVNLPVQWSLSPVYTPTGTTQTIDLGVSGTNEIDLDSATGDVDVTFSNIVAGKTYYLFTRQGATARDINLTNGVIAGGTVPNTVTLSIGNNDLDVLTFVGLTQVNVVLLSTQLNVG